MVMKVIAIGDGVESCHVGFLPWHVVSHVQEVSHLHGKLAWSWNCMTMVKWAAWGRISTAC